MEEINGNKYLTSVPTDKKKHIKNVWRTMINVI